MVDLNILNRWLTAPKETENLEFKEAKQQFAILDIKSALEQT